MTMDFDDLTLTFYKPKLCDYNKTSDTQWQKCRACIISHLILKISFLTLFGCVVKIKLDINQIYF